MGLHYEVLSGNPIGSSQACTKSALNTKKKEAKTLSWVSVEELNLSYYKKETPFLTLCPYYGNLI